MENLLFSLNATIPIFLLMVVGYFLNKMNILESSSLGLLYDEEDFSFNTMCVSL